MFIFIKHVCQYSCIQAMVKLNPLGRWIQYLTITFHVYFLEQLWQCLEHILVRKDIDVNDHEGVFNFTLRLKSSKVTAIFIALRKVSIYQRGNQKP